MDDLRIIELYFNRDEQAIKETDAKYGKLCHSIAYNILNNHEDSEECVNDTYVSDHSAYKTAQFHALYLQDCTKSLFEATGVYEAKETVSGDHFILGRACGSIAG